jgi:hypothetical protein
MLGMLQPAQVTTPLPTMQPPFYSFLHENEVSVNKLTSEGPFFNILLECKLILAEAGNVKLGLLLLIIKIQAIITGCNQLIRQHH